MRAVVQRVRSARITVAGEEVSRMAAGLLALVAAGRDDTPESAQELARRLVNLRIFGDSEARMNRSLLDTGGTLGLVSNFTLYGDARHGRRPSFGDAAPAEVAESLLGALARAARELGVPVVSGRFRADMDVELVNQGPVTILLDTARQF